MQRAARAGVVLMLIVLAALGATSIGLRAFAQQTPPTTDAPAKPAPPPADDSDSAQTIEDDPTVAPDDEASADNNITFPVDI